MLKSGDGKEHRYFSLFSEHMKSLCEMLVPSHQKLYKLKNCVAGKDWCYLHVEQANKRQSLCKATTLAIFTHK